MKKSSNLFSPNLVSIGANQLEVSKLNLNSRCVFFCKFLTFLGKLDYKKSKLHREKREIIFSNKRKVKIAWITIEKYQKFQKISKIYFKVKNLCESRRKIIEKNICVTYQSKIKVCHWLVPKIRFFDSIVRLNVSCNRMRKRQRKTCDAFKCVDKAKNEILWKIINHWPI